jgi:hypothetical protein
MAPDHILRAVSLWGKLDRGEVLAAPSARMVFHVSHIPHVNL